MKRVNISNLKTCLEDLSSREFQERTWFAENGPEISLFSEQVSQLFDDTGLSDCIEKPELTSQLGYEAVNCLQQLDKLIESVDHSTPPRVLIQDPKMQEIRDSAGSALRHLNAFEQRLGSRN